MFTVRKSRVPVSPHFSFTDKRHKIAAHPHWLPIKEASPSQHPPDNPPAQIDASSGPSDTDDQSANSADETDVRPDSERLPDGAAQ